ncbi:MAG: two-component sensor histidine kinase, partial [Ottowia sp.]|nr:two-component sensor histidine kinase [Ottowia sp.]
ATIAGCDRATHLVAQLLQLARLEAEADSGGARGDGPRPAGCELAQVVDETVRELAPTAAARGQRIVWHAPGAPVPAATGAPLAAVLLRNLLD